MTRILALDPASIMGFAHGPHNGVPVHGVHRLPVKSGHSRIGLALEEFLIGLIRVRRVCVTSSVQLYVIGTTIR